jgi:hypothetical protein
MKMRGGRRYWIEVSERLTAASMVHAWNESTHIKRLRGMGDAAPRAPHIVDVYMPRDAACGHYLHKVCGPNPILGRFSYVRYPLGSIQSFWSLVQ